MTTLPFRGLDFKTMLKVAHLAESRSLKETAQAFSCSASVVSEAISSMESLQQISLFVRKNKVFIAQEVTRKIVRDFNAMILLERFACINVGAAQADLAWLKIKCSDAMYSGSLNNALLSAIADVNQLYPNVLVIPDYVEAHFGPSEQESAWRPAWRDAGQVDFMLESQTGEADCADPMAGQWMILHSPDVTLPDPMSVQDLKNWRFVIPRMPWELLQHISGICERAEINFVYDNRHFYELCALPPDAGQLVLINTLSMDECIHDKWHVSEFPVSTWMSVKSSVYQDSPVTAYFLKAFAFHLASLPRSYGLARPRTTLKQWYYFANVIECGSIRRAAEQLYLTQPALSTQVQQLETALGMRVFDRKTGSRRVHVNAAGGVLWAIFEGMDFYVRRVQQTLQQLRLARQDRLSLGILPSIDVQSRVIALIADQVTTWQQLHADVRLEIVEERHQFLADALRAQSIHLAFIETEMPWLVQHVVTTPEPMGLVCSTALAGRPAPVRLQWSELQRFPLVLPRKVTGMRELIDRHCLSHGLELRPSVESDSLNLNRRWLLDGRYAAILPRSAVASLIESGELMFIEVEPPLYRKLHLSYLKNRALNKVEKDLIDFLIDHRTMNLQL
ncbi:LysR family transcriptional regulator [Advenella mimigardefordensis]|uniref:Putative transcriptional regulator, LysR family n=1 Tax=Advenella mimigardefordensis (strain DSM 17166 / LMG 22922 / DPN7) TaxID=1247726 RepID=W0P6S8_ADVMD|nr:LysR family transcriptional regulator [Advenella mimigardefordensis]AHG62466.1 putative transcriptional regulator, LysR family [Advenella mimigardefordensis DPN7]